MVSDVIFLEGSKTGPDSKNEQRECREAFKGLLIKCGFSGRLPRLFACGPRHEAFNDFKAALKGGQYPGFVAMLIDSEDPVGDIEKTWKHLKERQGDGWDKPKGASDDQVLFMTTCQETWVLADHQSKAGKSISESLERKSRDDILSELEKKTNDAYKKEHGRQFKWVREIDPDRIQALPSFARVRQILNEKLVNV